MTARPYLMKVPCVDCGRTIVCFNPRRLRCDRCIEMMYVVHHTVDSNNRHLWRKEPDLEVEV